MFFKHIDNSLGPIQLSDDEILAEFTLAEEEVKTLISQVEKCKDPIGLSYPSVPIYYSYKQPEEDDFNDCAPVFLDYSKQTADILSLNSLQSSYESNNQIRQNLKEIDAGNASGIEYILENPDLAQKQKDYICDEILKVWAELFSGSESNQQLAEYHNYLSEFDEFIYKEIKKYITVNCKDEYAALKATVSRLETQCSANGSVVISKDYFEAKLEAIVESIETSKQSLSVLQQQSISHEEAHLTDDLSQNIQALEQEIEANELSASTFENLISEIKDLNAMVKALRITLKKSVPEIIIEHSADIASMDGDEFAFMVYTEGLLGLADLDLGEQEKLIFYYINDFATFYFNINKLNARHEDPEFKDQGIMCQVFDQRMKAECALRNNLSTRLQLQSPLIKQGDVWIRLNGPTLQPHQLKSFRVHEDLVSSDTHIVIDLNAVTCGQDFFDIMLASILVQPSQALPIEIQHHIKDIEEGNLEVALCPQESSPLSSILSNVDCVKDAFGEDEIFTEHGESFRKLVAQPTYKTDIQNKLINYLRGDNNLRLSLAQREHLSHLCINPLLPVLTHKAKQAIEAVKLSYESSMPYGLKETMELHALFMFINKITKHISANGALDNFLNAATLFLNHYSPVKHKHQQVLTDIFKRDNPALLDVLKIFFVFRQAKNKRLVLPIEALQTTVGDLFKANKRSSKRLTRLMLQTGDTFFQDSKSARISQDSGNHLAPMSDSSHL